jgi:hypothetical protein
MKITQSSKKKQELPMVKALFFALFVALAQHFS